MNYVVKVADDPSANLISVASSAAGSFSRPLSVTVEGGMGNGVWSTTFIPQEMRHVCIVEAVSGNRLSISWRAGSPAYGPDTTVADTLVDGAFDGASCRFYRVLAGGVTRTVDTTVTKFHARALRPLPEYSGSLNGAYVPAGTSVYRHKFDDWNRPNSLQWFGVAAINASGNVGPIAWTTFTSGALSSEQPSAPTNTLLTDVDRSAPDSGGPAAPTNLAATSESDGWIVALTWTDTPGAHGHVVYRCPYDPSDLLSGAVDVADATGIQVGDVFTISKMFGVSGTLEEIKSEVLSNRAWGTNEAARFIPDLVYSPDDETWAAISHFEDDEEGWVRRCAPSAGERCGVTAYTHSGGEDEFYYDLEPGQEYAVEARVKGSGSLTLRVDRGLDPAAGTNFITTLSIPDDGQWHTLSATFTPNSAFGGATALQTRVYSTGTTFDIAWMGLRQTHTPLGALTPDEISRLSSVNLVRNHFHIKSNLKGCHTLSVVDQGFTSRRGLGRPSVNLWRFLKAMEDAGCNPWLQFEWVWTEEEWTDLAEILFAPYDPEVDTPAAKPWAYRRYQKLGWELPVIDKFPEIWFEVGNENWNGLGSFYVMPSVNGLSTGTVHGLWVDYVVGLIKASAYWQPSYTTKFKIYAGGWHRQILSGFTADTAATSKEADYVGGADYNGGWDSGLSAALDPTDPSAWVYTLGNGLIGAPDSRYERAAAMKSLCDAVSDGRAKPVKPAIYEAGPGYVLNGLNGATVDEEEEAAQELIMKSVGGGTATFDAWLINAANGVELNNFFRWQRGILWSSHATVSNGGSANPPWMWTEWLNTTFPDGFTISEPSAFVGPSETFDPEIEDAVTANPLGVFRLEASGKIALAVLNRSPVNSYSIAVSVTGVAGKALSLTAMDGIGATVTIPDVSTGGTRDVVLSNGYQAVNNTMATKDNVTLTTVPMPFTDRIEVTILPGLACVWVWE